MTTMMKMILVMRTIVTMMMTTEITTTLEMSATHGFHRHKERASGEIRFYGIFYECLRQSCDSPLRAVGTIRRGDNRKKISWKDDDLIDRSSRQIDVIRQTDVIDKSEQSVERLTQEKQADSHSQSISKPLK